MLWRSKVPALWRQLKASGEKVLQIHAPVQIGVLGAAIRRCVEEFVRQKETGPSGGEATKLSNVGGLLRAAEVPFV